MLQKCKVKLINSWHSSNHNYILFVLKNNVLIFTSDINIVKRNAQVVWDNLLIEKW